MKSTKAARFSPSSLNLFLDCARCFWLEKVKSIKRPRGIFPSLPGGMDRVIKTHFDLFRPKGVLPPELKGRDFEGIKLFPDQKLLEKWRDWRTGLTCQTAGGAQLIGALDDLLVKDGLHVPFDYKTKGSPTTEADAIRYYQNQLDCYALLLELNKFQTAGFAFLLYFSPQTMSEQGSATFHVQAIRIATDPRRAEETIKKAVSSISGPMPASGERCEYCAWLERMKQGN